MAYACPVCDAVEADAEHLAHHLAVTASLHEGDHAAWLDDHAPDWPEQSPSELGATAIEHAEERVIEDEAHTHDHGDVATPDVQHAQSDPATGTGRQLDAETKRALQEARELMERECNESG
ncbi:MAG: DUF5810 domain-containing protein [Halobacteriales archaeon]